MVIFEYFWAVMIVVNLILIEINRRLLKEINRRIELHRQQVEASHLRADFVIKELDDATRRFTKARRGW